MMCSLGLSIVTDSLAAFRLHCYARFCLFASVLSFVLASNHNLVILQKPLVDSGTLGTKGNTQGHCNKQQQQQQQTAVTAITLCWLCVSNEQSLLLRFAAWNNLFVTCDCTHLNSEHTYVLYCPIHLFISVCVCYSCLCIHPHSSIHLSVCMCYSCCALFDWELCYLLYNPSQHSHSSLCACVAVVVPFLTENYGASEDPPETTWATVTATATMHDVMLNSPLLLLRHCYAVVVETQCLLCCLRTVVETQGCTEASAIRLLRCSAAFVSVLNCCLVTHTVVVNTRCIVCRCSLVMTVRDAVAMLLNLSHSCFGRKFYTSGRLTVFFSVGPMQHSSVHSQEFP